MGLRNIINIPKYKYSARVIMKWLWQAWKGNRLQATLNALIGVMLVVISLAQVWAVQHAIDVAAGAQEGDIYWAVGLMGFFIICEFAMHISSIWVTGV